jgi:L-threonylcarbamoyladenylate synthase
MQNIYSLALNELTNHRVIAFPTETVFGLGAFYDDFEAYSLLNRIKNRREDKPYTMMLYDVKEISKYAVVDKKYIPIIEKYMPGSLTILLRAKENIPSYVTQGTNVIGIRIPSNEEALELLEAVKKPLLVPSANKADQPPALTKKEVKEIFKDEIDLIIPGETNVGKASTIIDLTTGGVILVREGPISLKEILESINQ